jgi:hypothetical protein
MATSNDRSGDMMRAHDDAENGAGELPLDPASMEELRELLARLCDDQLTESDRPRLNYILDSHEAARRYYLKYVAIHSSLAAMAGSASAADAQLAVERITLARFAGRSEALLPACDVVSLRDEHLERWKSVMRWAAGISAVLLTAVAVWWLAPRGSDPASPVNLARVGNAASFDREESTGSVTTGREPLVAEVTYVSNAAVWQNPNGSFTLASRVRAGQNLTLERGQVELTYGTGAKLLLTGPSEFLVRSTGGKLRRGELVARVPEAGHGFTIETPHGKVIDLGTEFGVVVDDFGVSQVSVFEGKVETLPTGSSGAAQDKIELTSGRAIQWTENSIIPISVQGRRYGRSGNDAASGDPVPATSQALVDADFRGQPLELASWKMLGDVISSEHGARLQGTTAQRPYLMTAQELDPAAGAITVVCDLRFEKVHDAENASVAILTRSADSQSKPGTPWHDMLARSVRCRLLADLLSGEGLLEAGTKYEADREYTNISWGGFSQPRPDTRYRLEMRDDGLNVSFTVSLAENPSVRKTITCRSLFRGNQNFVALEGPSSGAVVVERLVISQDVLHTDELRTLAAATVHVSTPEEVSDEELASQLDRLAPAGAELILHDTFDGAELNPDLWKTLGEVVVVRGQVQLGLPNEEQHIDTWNARPYLLTKRKYDSGDGPLTILGKVTFAENFLHGYGGSFAVMTRADDEHSSGPGWENSILRRGVRSNFWPAAYGFDHSLEIHEKPAPNTISLLVAEGFPIAPSSRSYLFRIVDDGDSATLTFLDAHHLPTRKTVSHTTGSEVGWSGHVGFESWLDDVRIYRGGTSRD